MDLAAVLEEEQSRLRQGPIAFRKGGFLHALGHGPLDPDGYGRRSGRRLTRLAPTAAAQAGFGFRRRRLGRLPFGIFHGRDDHAVGLAGQGRLFAVDAQREIVGGELQRCRRSEEPGFNHNVLFGGKRSFGGGYGMTGELRPDANGSGLHVRLIIGGRGPRRESFGFFLARGVLTRQTNADRGGQETDLRSSEKSHFSYEANIPGRRTSRSKGKTLRMAEHAVRLVRLGQRLQSESSSLSRGRPQRRPDDASCWRR